MDTAMPLNAFEADGSSHRETFWISTGEALECPFCFTQIETQPLTAIIWDTKELQLFLKCKKRYVL